MRLVRLDQLGGGYAELGELLRVGDLADEDSCFLLSRQARRMAASLTSAAGLVDQLDASPS